MTRTYVQRYSGVPKGSFFNPETGDYSVKFIHQPNSEPNRLYINEKNYYPKGYDISCALKVTGQSVDIKVSPLWEKNYVSVEILDDSVADKLVVLTITPWDEVQSGVEHLKNGLTMEWSA